MGLPCALAAAEKHDVVGYDPDQGVQEILRTRRYPHREAGAQELLEKTPLQVLDSVAAVVAHSEIVFVAVQTPHAPEYEGITRLSNNRADFDYSFLTQAVRDIAWEAKEQGKPIALAIISTVLPGTCRREVLPLLNPWVRLVYNPFFIAMGTTIRDYLNPEFVLIGTEDKTQTRVEEFYRALHDRPIRHMSIESAELTKVLYNCFIGLKIILANTAMEICDRLGGNCDGVMAALASASDRLTSPRYLRPGMGDGGGCHPRDNIALSWLSRSLGMHYDLFGMVMLIRERQTEYLADLAARKSDELDLPVVVLGKAFKPETGITTGSPAVLLFNILSESGVDVHQYDPEIDSGSQHSWPARAVFVIATNHESFRGFDIPRGSVVIDPWGEQSERDGVETVRVGRE